MMEFLSNHQLNFMLFMCSGCFTIALFVMVANALPKRRRIVLFLFEICAMFLLFFDRLAYMYSGDTSAWGYVMVRVTNFLVFSLTLCVILALNGYMIDLLVNEGGMTEKPKELKLVTSLCHFGIVLVIVSQFTGWYYYFDEGNKYHRGPLFILCYLFPIITTLIQLFSLIKHRKKLNKGIRLSLFIFILVPVVSSIIQIFAYGLSLTNMAIVGAAVVVYVFAIKDINEKIRHANEIEIGLLKQERMVMQRLFEQTASSFVNALDDKNTYTKGHSLRVANYSRKIAKSCGMNEKACDEVYYSALLHDVGKIGIPDEIIRKDEDASEEEMKILKESPLIGEKILAGIEDFPYLKICAKYVNERFDGSGYPEGLKGNDIPEIARIVAVADYYDTLTSPKNYRDAFPQVTVRGEFIKGSGTKFDPRFAGHMITLIDNDPQYLMSANNEINEDPYADFSVDKYRSEVSKGILIENVVTEIEFEADLRPDSPIGFSAPSFLLFDSFDDRVHVDERTINAFNYLEYAEVWFDGHSVSTSARNIEAKVTKKEIEREGDKSQIFDDNNKYKIKTGRYDDHIKITFDSPVATAEIIVALPEPTRWAYIGLTGEYCHIKNIKITKTEQPVLENDIPRIARPLTYKDRFEGDIPNIEISGNRTKASEGIEVTDGMILRFHTMTFPSAIFFWNCPYIVLYSSDNGEVNGPGYKEFALVKLNGENACEYEYAENTKTLEKNVDFTDWESWIEKNKKGLECVVSFKVKGLNIITRTEDCGIVLNNTTKFNDIPDTVYAAITGDQCIVTDIRIRK